MAAALLPKTTGLYPATNVLPSGADSQAIQYEARTKPNLRLHLEVEAPSGGRYRWGEDEPQAANVLANLSFSTTMPGGFDTLDCTLARKPGVDYSDVGRLSTIRAFGVGGRLAGEYRLERSPRTINFDHMEISPSAVGWQAHLTDDTTFTETFVGRDLDHWEPASRQWRIDAYANGVVKIGDIEVLTDEFTTKNTPDVGSAVVQLVMPSGPALPKWTTAQYDAGVGSGISEINSTYKATNMGTVPFANGYAGLLGSAASDAWFGLANVDYNSGFDFLVTTNSGTTTYTQGTAAPAGGYRYGLIWLVNTSLLADGDYPLDMGHLTVWGTTGLTKRGTYPDNGYYASDIVTSAVTRAAPLLRVKPGQTVGNSGFIIPHAVYHEPVSAADVIADVNRYELWDWAVWDDRTFWYQPRGFNATRWVARVGPSQLAETGSQVDRLWNGVVVVYQDVSGTTMRVGPPGSGANTEYQTLADTDPENPINQYGFRRWATLDMGIVSTAAGAARVGEVFIEEQKLLDGSGSANIVGSCLDDKGTEQPAWAIRAGDEISFIDSFDKSWRRIVRTTYDHSSRTTTLDLDAPPDAMEALLARLGASIQPLGF